MKQEKSRSPHLGDADGRHRHRQVMFKSDKENPVKVAQRELAARPKKKVHGKPDGKTPMEKAQDDSKRHGGKRGAARDWVDQGAEEANNKQR